MTPFVSLPLSYAARQLVVGVGVVGCLSRSCSSVGLYSVVSYHIVMSYHIALHCIVRFASCHVILVQNCEFCPVMKVEMCMYTYVRVLPRGVCSLVHGLSVVLIFGEYFFSCQYMLRGGE